MSLSSQRFPSARGGRTPTEGLSSQPRALFLVATLAASLSSCAPSNTLGLTPSCLDHLEPTATVLTITGLRPEQHLEAGRELRVCEDLRVLLRREALEPLEARPVAVTATTIEVHLDLALLPPEGDYDLEVLAKGRSYRLAEALRVAASCEAVDADVEAEVDGDSEVDADADP